LSSSKGASLACGERADGVSSGLPSVLPRCLVLDQGGRLAMVDLEIEAWLACRGGVGDVWCLPDAVAGVVVWMLVDGVSSIFFLAHAGARAHHRRA